jgi:proteasome lid subunit RPN8/RPN11
MDGFDPDVCCEGVTGEPLPLTLPSRIYDLRIASCRDGAPLACCGILAGESPCVAAIDPLRNAAASRERYAAEPQELLRAARRCDFTEGISRRLP